MLAALDLGGSVEPHRLSYFYTIPMNIARLARPSKRAAMALREDSDWRHKGEKQQNGPMWEQKLHLGHDYGLQRELSL